MPRPEKTVFISYRRKDMSWALAVYQSLTANGYDVFFDYTSIHSGDFENIIIGNIKARAHFLVILTPNALDRCNEPEDWLRREIETAIDERRNIIPLFFDGFDFSSPSVVEKLTGKLAKINQYNGLEIPSGYFAEAMERLRNRYLSVPMEAVLHPVSNEVRRRVEEEKVAVNKLLQQRGDSDKPVRPREADEKSSSPKSGNVTAANNKKLSIYSIGIGLGILFVIACCSIFSISYLMKYVMPEAAPTHTRPPFVESTVTLTNPVPTDTAIIPSVTPTPAPPTPVPTLGIGSSKTGRDSMTQYYVPAGEFTMGSNAGNADEQPEHIVYLDAYWIDQTEVTNAMFAEFLNQLGNQTEGSVTWLDSESGDVRIRFDGNLWNPVAGYENHPVVEVSWYGAVAYCSWVDRRLPTDAEWEKAARGINDFTFPWGNFDPNGNLLNYNKLIADTTEVGSYPDGASPYGALDMAGNVWEWTSDRYASTYYRDSPSSNPQGPATGEGRVRRSGSWDDDYDFVRSASRTRLNPAITNVKTGFRCVQSE